MKSPQRCSFRFFTAQQLRQIADSKRAAADAGVPHDPRNEPLPRLINFVTWETPQAGDELATDIDNQSIRVKVLKRTFVFMAAENDPNNVSVNLDVQEVA